MKPIQQQPSPQPMGGIQAGMPRKRPLGVAIIAVLVAIGGILVIVGGVVLAAFAGLLGSMSLPQGYLAVSSLFFAFSGVLAGVLIIFGLVYLVLAWGFWSGKGWGWTVGVIFLILGIVLDLVSFAIVGIGSLVGLLIDVLILYYLFRPHVKAYFGKGQTVL